MKFDLNEIELKRAKVFAEMHRCGFQDPDTGLNYINISYIFKPTEIGVAIDVVCTICHTKEDITDYHSW